MRETAPQYAGRDNCSLHRCVFLLFLFVTAAASMPLRAQLSFPDAIRLSVQNSPKLKAAENDSYKARQNHAAMKDMFIPSVVAGGGVGTAYGITLNVPTIFTINAQSLIYNGQQHSYIQSASMDLKAAGLALEEARYEVEEDAVITYLSLHYTQNTEAALTDEFSYAVKLVSVIQDRVNGKLDSEFDLKKARRAALEIRLHQMQAEDNIESLREHLAGMTMLPTNELSIVPQSIPDMPEAAVAIDMNQASLESRPESWPESPGIRSAEAHLRAKTQQARGDAQYAWRPQMSFGAQYGRISPIESVSKFYNLNGNYNTASIGVQIQLPLLDEVRKASARQSAADAARAALDLDSFRKGEAEGRRKLQRSAAELEVKAKLAELNYGIAQDELQSILIRLHAADGSLPVTPKEEQNAHIEERQKYLELIDAKGEVMKAEVSYLRQSGQLESWLQSSTGFVSSAQSQGRTTPPR